MSSAAALENGRRDVVEAAALFPGGVSDATSAKDEFEAYQQKYGRSYAHGSKEYLLRRGLFEQRNARVKAHNSKFGRLWEAEAGRFADLTDEERASFRGYRRMGSSPSSGGVRLPAEAIAARELLRPLQSNVTLPPQFDWKHLKVANYVKDQAQCGSCWAVTAASVLDAHHEIYMKTVRNFSAQQIVTCAPDPRHCGGTGKCQGSTVELAYDWVLHNGCATSNDVPYKGQDLTESSARCNESRALSVSANSGLFGAKGGEPHQTMSSALGGIAFGMIGYRMLDRNKEQPLLHALYQDGPVATSACADGWFEYQRGIYDECNSSCIVNHAITLYGYGEAHYDGADMRVLVDGEVKTRDKVTKKYWLIRNSWGRNWGEGGFLRLLRYDQENQHCGQDTDNSQGTGCEGDPQVVEVCGMCGFLWDSVVPHFHNSADASGGNSSDSGLVQTDVTAQAALKIVRRETSDF
jgi:cathepsin L